MILNKRIKREFVENFSQKDIMEVWVIDENGKVVVSSSGFEIPLSIILFVKQ